jgi:type IV conjugative transfer system protein TraL
MRHTDSSVKILLWTKGELLLILGPFFLGIFLDAFVLGVVAGALNSWGISSFKKNFGKGLLQAVRYWYLPYIEKLKEFYDSSVREYA